MQNTSPLTHASVFNVRNWVLDGILDSVPSSSILKALFGIPGDNPSPVDITDKIASAGSGVRATLIDKTKKGTLWEFTTDFGITAVFQKLFNDQLGSYVYHTRIRYVDGDGNTVERPIVSYNARHVTYFDVGDKVVLEKDAPTQSGDGQSRGFQFTTEEKVNEPVEQQSDISDVQEQKEEDIGAGENAPEPSDEALDAVPQETSGDQAGGDIDDEPESMTEVSDLDDDDDSTEDEEMTIEKTRTFVQSLVQNLKDGNSISDDSVKAGCQIVFENSETTIEHNRQTGRALVSVVDNGKCVTVEVEDWVTSKSPAQAPTVETKAEEQIVLEPAEEKIKPCSITWDDPEEILNVRTSNKILNFLKEEIDKGVKDEAALTRAALSEAGSASVDLEKVGISVRFIAGEEGDTVSVQVWSYVPEEPEKAEEPVEQENIESAPTEEVVAETEASEEEPAVVDDPQEPDVQTEPKDTNILEEGSAEEVPEVKKPAPHKWYDLTIGISGTIDPDVVTSVKDTLRYCIDEIGYGDIDKLRDMLADRLGRPLSIEFPEGGHLISVILTEDKSDEKEPESNDTKEEDKTMDETEASELEQVMNTDKETEPITVDPNYIDLSDRETRDRVIQVLFPGVTDPGYTHLYNFLKGYHTSEQTESYLETNGTFPTETCIVYSNLTFSIVKMKDGRYWRIFAARTDCGLSDPTWLATKYMHNRWYQLGHDISNNVDYVRENRGGSMWRRRNSLY